MKAWLLGNPAIAVAEYWRGLRRSLFVNLNSRRLAMLMEATEAGSLVGTIKSSGPSWLTSTPCPGSRRNMTPDWVVIVLG
jgi:hypothetical protein